MNSLTFNGLIESYNTIKRDTQQFNCSKQLIDLFAKDLPYTTEKYNSLFGIDLYESRLYPITFPDGTVAEGALITYDKNNMVTDILLITNSNNKL